MPEFSMHDPLLRRAIHDERQFGGEAAVHAARFEISRQVSRDREQHGAIGCFRERAVRIRGMLEFQIDIPVRGMGVNITAALEDLNIAVDRMQVAD